MIKSIEKYRLFDLCLLSVLAIISEVIGELLHIKLPGAGYYISFSILVAIIALIRWGAWGTVVYVAAGIPMVFLAETSLFESILLYPFSYAFIILTALMFIVFKRDDFRENNLLLLLLTTFAILSVSIGKGLAMYFLVGVFFESIIYYWLTQLFSLVIVFLVLLIIKNRDGLLVNMRQYLNNSNG